MMAASSFHQVRTSTGWAAAVRRRLCGELCCGAAAGQRRCGAGARQAAAVQVRHLGVVPGTRCVALPSAQRCGWSGGFACAAVRAADNFTERVCTQRWFRRQEMTCQHALHRTWVARVAELVPDKNQTVRTAVVAVLHRVYAAIDPECLVRHVATAPRQAQHHLLQALLSSLPDLPQQVCSPSFLPHGLHRL